MHRFTGNKLTGAWIYKEPGGCFNMMSVPEMLADNRVVWIMTSDSGELHWPHIMFPDQEPQEMVYNDE